MSVKQSIYQTFIKFGMTPSGAFGMMGNGERESNLEAGRVQGDFSAFRTVSKSYVARVTSGELSRDAFARDGLGFGIFQWTFYSRKYDLYDWWKASGKALDDPVMQCEFAVAELKKSYRNLWDLLCTSNDLYTCVKEVCVVYERPAHNNIDQRFTAAVAIKAELTDTPAEPEPQKAVYYPYRMIQKGMSGDDVIVLQAILKCRGYDCNRLDGEFDERTKNRVLAFQGENSDTSGQPLTTDGIVGKKTWGALLQY